MGMPKLELTEYGLFRLTASYTYEFPWNRERYVVLPMGMMTDFGTIPWFARWVISPTDRTLLLPAMVHDYLVRQIPWSGEAPRIRQLRPGGGEYLEYCDWDKAAIILKKAMQAEGAPTWKRMLVYWGVRLYGAFRER